MADSILDRVCMPWAFALNPAGAVHMNPAEARARACGLLEDSRDVARFRAFVRLDCHAFPHAGLRELTAAGAFNHWLYFMDDSYDDHPEVGHDLPRVEALMARAFEILVSGRLPRAPTGLERFTAQVRELLLELAPPGWFGRFLGHTHDYLFHGSLVAVALWKTGGPATVAEYLKVREHDSAVYSAIDTAVLAAGARLPPEIYAQPLMKELELRTVLHVGLLNDLFSYQKEVLIHGYPLNLVHVMAREQSLPFRLAAEAAVELINEQIALFQAAEKQLPAFGALKCDVDLYLSCMKAWMRGNYDYSLSSPRFRALDSPFDELRRPLLD